MGNGIPINLICCNHNKETNVGEDIDIKKNSIEYDKYAKTIKINKVEFQKHNNINHNLKIHPTYSILSSESDSKKKLINAYRRDSASHNDPNPNISLFNNTFQILNNTQQYISFSNMNLFKNNLINNNIFKHSINSNAKFNSSVINNNLDFNFKEIKSKLILTGELFLNQEIVIDKNGMKNGLRHKKDGKTIFGYKQDNKNNINIGNNNINTININNNINMVDYFFDLKFAKINKKRLYNKNNINKVFEIVLDKKEKGYVLNFVHNSLLLYYKINNSFFFELDRDYFLILGDIFMTINVKRSLGSKEKKVHIKVEIENGKPQRYVFGQKDVPIKIGRSNCEINIPKPSISKLHSVINFDNDLFYYNDKKSTNGSTLLLKEDDYILIKGEMHFKLEDIPFSIKEINIGDK